MPAWGSRPGAPSPQQHRARVPLWLRRLPHLRRRPAVHFACTSSLLFPSPVSHRFCPPAQRFSAPHLAVHLGTSLISPAAPPPFQHLGHLPSRLLAGIHSPHPNYLLSHKPPPNPAAPPFSGDSRPGSGDVPLDLICTGTGSPSSPLSSLLCNSHPSSFAWEHNHGTSSPPPGVSSMHSNHEQQRGWQWTTVHSRAPSPLLPSPAGIHGGAYDAVTASSFSGGTARPPSASRCSPLHG